MKIKLQHMNKGMGYRELYYKTWEKETGRQRGRKRRRAKEGGKKEGKEGRPTMQKQMSLKFPAEQEMLFCFIIEKTRSTKKTEPRASTALAKSLVLE